MLSRRGFIGELQLGILVKRKYFNNFALSGSPTSFAEVALYSNPYMLTMKIPKSRI